MKVVWILHLLEKDKLRLKKYFLFDLILDIYDQLEGFVFAKTNG